MSVSVSLNKHNDKTGQNHSDRFQHVVTLKFCRKMSKYPRRNCNIKDCETFGSLFCVPSEPIRRSKWIETIETFQEFDYTLSKFYVCEQHFSPESVIRRGARTYLASNAIPTIFTSIM